MNKESKRVLLTKVPLMLASSLLAGCAIAIWLPGGGNFSSGFLATSLLILLSEAILFFLWRMVGSGKLLAWLIILTFVLRLGSGISLSVLLPLYGHGSAEELAGHVFTDAYNRDQAAWNLAKSDQSLLSSFTQNFVSDQYGGLLALSATVYRYLSPDAHRPYLIQILAALAAAMGIPFFWAAVRKRWGDKVAKMATWILVLFPESILLGSYQMREPFLISLAVIAFWATQQWPEFKTKALICFGLSIFCMAVISSQMAIPIFFFCILWVLFDTLSNDQMSTKMKVRVWVGFVLFTVLVAAITWKWLFNRVTWNILVTVQNSGVLQSLNGAIGNGNSNLMRLTVTIYGIFQPVLPAVIIDPALFIWKFIGILRSMGWYLMIPFLVYGTFAVFKARVGKERKTLVMMVVMIWVWIIISSMRAGGGQWDDPRYRVIFLPWMALLVALAYQWVKEAHSPWLWRIVLVEGIFVVVFGFWYFSRYYPFGWVPSFSLIIFIIIGLSALFLAGCIGLDMISRQKRRI